jgi:hypothetical protein
MGWERQRVQVFDEGTVWGTDDFAVSTEGYAQNVIEAAFVFEFIQQFDEGDLTFAAHDYIRLGTR